LERDYATVLVPSIRDRLLAQLRSGNALFTRQGALVLAKLAVAFGGEETTSTIDLSTAIGLLFAAIHDHLGPSDSENQPEPGVYVSPLAASIAANQWFNRTLDEASFLATYEARWGELARRSTAGVTEVFQEVMGYEVEERAAVALAAWTGSRVEGHVAFDASYFDVLGLGAEKLNAILNTIALPVDLARDRIHPRELEPTTLEWNFDTFERYPLLQLRDGGYLVLDPGLLLRRTMGWAPLYDLETARAGRGPGHDLAHATESYFFEVLDSLYNSGPVRRCFTDSDLQVMQPVGRRADAAVDFGPSWAVLEVTARRPLRAMLHGQVVGLDEQMGIVLEELDQVAATARALQERRHLLLDEPASAGPIRIHPVVVFTEGFPTNPLTVNEVRRRADEAGLFSGLNTSAIEIIDLVELEMVESIADAGGPSFPEILEAKARSNFAADSLRNFLATSPDFDLERPSRISKIFSAPLMRVAARIGEQEGPFEDTGA
jgi:hypothetical protein